MGWIDIQLGSIKQRERIAMISGSVLVLFLFLPYRRGNEILLTYNLYGYF